jgi:hypothetical protein
MNSGLSQNHDLQGVQIWQMGEQSGRDAAELRALQRPICINKKKISDFFLRNEADWNLNKLVRHVGCLANKFAIRTFAQKGLTDVVAG